MTNTTIIATLEAQPVPADRECVLTGTQILKLAQDYLAVAGLASGNISAGVTPATGTGGNVTNNTAAQALAVANEAKSIALVLQGEKKERRAATQRIQLVQGDSVVPVSWSPPMPNTLYHLSITLWGSNEAILATGQPGFRLVSGTETTGSIMVNFGNQKPGMSFTWLLTEL